MKPLLGTILCSIIIFLSLVSAEGDANTDQKEEIPIAVNIGLIIFFIAFSAIVAGKLSISTMIAMSKHFLS